MVRKSTFNNVHFDRNLFTRSCEGGWVGGWGKGEGFNDFSFGTFIGCFESDGTVSTAEKVLSLKKLQGTVFGLNKKKRLVQMQSNDTIRS